MLGDHKSHIKNQEKTCEFVNHIIDNPDKHIVSSSITLLTILINTFSNKKS